VTAKLTLDDVEYGVLFVSIVWQSRHLLIATSFDIFFEFRCQQLDNLDIPGMAHWGSPTDWHVFLCRARMTSKAVVLKNHWIYRWCIKFVSCDLV
jgi:hypothetical protein